MAKLDNATAEHSAQRLDLVLNHLDAAMRLSMVHGQGKEMTNHQALSAATGIQVFLGHPCSPWDRGGDENTNGMVERFHGRDADVLRSHRFHGGEDLEQTLLRQAVWYNHEFPPSALKSSSAIHAMKDGYAPHRSDWFVKRPCDHLGCGTDQPLKETYHDQKDGQACISDCSLCDVHRF